MSSPPAAATAAKPRSATEPASARTRSRIEAIGAVDEANAALGLLRLHTEGEEDALLARVQNGLFDLGADLCVPGEGGARLRIGAAHVPALEAATTALNATCRRSPPSSCPAARPAPPRRISRAPSPAGRSARWCGSRRRRRSTREVLRYLNRLSDLLFVLSRRLNDNGARDVLWQPGSGA